MKFHWLFCACLVLLSPDHSAAQAPMGTPPAGSSPAQAAAPAAPLSPAQQIAPVIQEAIRVNSERLQGVEMTLSRTLENAGVTKEETIVEPLPDGGKLVTKIAPVQSLAERVVVLENQIRVDQGGTSSVPSVTYWFDGVRWTEANTAVRRVAKMHPDQIGGRSLDPRESTGLDYRTSLSKLLAQSALKEARVSTEGSITRIETDSTPGGLKLVLDFDSNFGMLPTRSQLFHLNGALARSVTIAYTWIADRNAWALASIADRVYDEGADGLAEPSNWKQQVTTAVTCTLLDRETAQSLLQPTVPEGFRVVDFTDPAFRARNAPQLTPPAAAGLSLRTFLLAHVALFAVLAAVIVWRRRRTSPV